MKRRLLAILLPVLLLCTSIPMGAIPVSAEVTSGTTGDCIWTLIDGHLTISGNGKMGNYYFWDDNTSAPWGFHITSVTIEDGVTSIGEHAFYYSDLLTTVVIGNSITSIGYEAFSLCYSLSSIIIPKSVTRIAFSAFHECNSLNDVYYYGNVADRGHINILAENDNLLTATWHYNYGVEPNSAPGDTNDDGNINNKDLAMLQQYLNDWDVNVNKAACDVNNDGNVNNKDLALLQQYLNDWDIKLE